MREMDGTQTDPEAEVRQVPAVVRHCNARPREAAALPRPPSTWSVYFFFFWCAALTGTVQPPFPLQEFFPAQPLSPGAHPPCPLQSFLPLQSCFRVAQLPVPLESFFPWPREKTAEPATMPATAAPRALLNSLRSIRSSPICGVLDSLSLGFTRAGSSLDSAVPLGVDNPRHPRRARVAFEGAAPEPFGFELPSKAVAVHGSITTACCKPLICSEADRSGP